MSTASIRIISLQIILILNTSVRAQFNVNTNLFLEGSIYLLDGNIKTGLIQPPNIAAQKKVTFKSNESSQTEQINGELISSIEVKSKNGNTFYFDNLPIGNVKKSKASKRRFFLFVQARNNFVSFYVMCTYRTDYVSGDIIAVAKYIQGKDVPTYTYFMSKDDKKRAVLFYGTGQIGGIKKNAELHFSEDPELVQKIQNKELKGKDLDTIISIFLQSTSNL